MKTRLPMIFTIILLMVLLLTACGFRVINGSGQISSESRAVSDFTTVDFPGFATTIASRNTKGD